MTLATSRPRQGERQGKYSSPKSAESLAPSSAQPGTVAPGLSSKMAKNWMAPMTRVATGIKSYPKKQESQLERVGGMFLCRDGENTDRNHQPAYGDFLKWGYP